MRHEENTFLVMGDTMKGAAVTSSEAIPLCSIYVAASDDDDDNVNADGFMCVLCIPISWSPPPIGVDCVAQLRTNRFWQLCNFR